MPYINGVILDVITDVAVSETSETTDHALEDGEQITDHVKANPITITLKGVILDEAESKVLQLRKYREEGEKIAYDYMSPLQNMVITSFGRDYNAKIKDGYAFTMTLKQIRVVKVAAFVSMPVAIKAQTKPVTKKGRQQTKKTVKSTAKTTQTKYTTTKKPAANLGQAGLEGHK